MSADNNATATQPHAANVEVDFELGEDVSQRNTAREKAWASTKTEGREQLSARETMIRYGSSLQQSIRTFQYVTGELMWILERKLTLPLARQVTDFLFYDSGRLITFCNMLRNRDYAHYNDLVKGSDTAFQICVRTRPLFEHEQAVGEYKTVFCQPLDKRQINVHEGSLDRSGRRMEMIHHNLMFHKLWDESVSNQEVCKDILDPLVDFVEQGKSATVIMYGQTGTGKTYTLKGLFRRLCTLLLNKRVEVTFIEIDGRKTYDLMDNCKPVKLLSDSDDNVHVKGAVSQRLLIGLPSEMELREQLRQAQLAGAALAAAPTLVEEDEEEIDDSTEDDSDNPTQMTTSLQSSNTEESPSTATAPPSTSEPDFFSAVMRALEARSQLVTERNPVSSRTHAVCQIRVIPENADGDAPGTSTTVSGGPYVLTLVDLAGSERKYETMHMSVREHKRSADINYTLMTLRHVFRTYNAKLAAAAQARQKKQGRDASVSADGFPRTSRAGPAELRRLTTKKMTKARAALRQQADHFVLASHFRGSPLTRILRASFTGDVNSHRTKVGHC